MLVRNRVIDHDQDAFADREIVEVCARIELDLVADDRNAALARAHRCRDDGQDSAIVDVAVVGEHVDDERLVLVAAGAVGDRDRRVVEAGDGEGEGAVAAQAAVGCHIGEAVLHDIAQCQRLGRGVE